MLRDLPFEDLGTALETLAAAGEDESVVRYVRHVVSDNHRVEQIIALLDAGDVRAAGPVLNEGHASLRDDLRVSCQELDLVVSAANAAGALGARMTGGGFGGSAIVLVEEATADTVAKAVTEAFSVAGHATPGVFPAVPSAGAGGSLQLLDQDELRDAGRVVLDLADHLVPLLPVEVRGLEAPGLQPGAGTGPVVAGEALRLGEEPRAEAEAAVAAVDPEQVHMEPVGPGPPAQPGGQPARVVQEPDVQRDFVLGGGGVQGTQLR